MNPMVLYLGFAVIAGLLGGYLSARRGKGLIVLALWAVSALSIFLYPIWLDSGDGPGASNAAVVLYSGLIPFGLGVVMGSISGAIMRLVFERGDKS